MLHSVSAAWMRRPLIKGFESPLICPSGSLDFVLDDAAGMIWQPVVAGRQLAAFV
jgi:hypothetical protein